MADAYNILWAVVLAGVIAQGIKILVIMFKHKQGFHIKDLFVTGGMPSTHSALVTSLAISIYLFEGITVSFILSLVLAVIVIRDAMGVRRSVGEEGKLINKIIKAVKIPLPKAHFALGHMPVEVWGGIIIGALSSLLVYFV